MSRTPAVVRIAALSAVAIGLSAVALPSALASGGRSRSLSDELVARAGGYASFRASHGGVGAFFGTAPGHPAVRPSNISASAKPTDAAKGWLGHYGALFHAAGAFDPVKSTPVPGGGSVVTMQQRIGGLPVVAGQVAVALTSNNDLVTLAGSTLPAGTVAVRPQVSSRLAGVLARRAVARRGSVTALSASAPVLSVLDPSMIGGAPASPAGARTVWSTTVTSSDGTLRHQVFIDAQRGISLLNIDANPKATRLVCDAQDVRLSEAAASCSTTPAHVSYLPDPGSSGDTDAVNAYQYAGAVDDFYSSLLKRNSLDGNGMTLAATVHYCDNSTDSNGNFTSPCPGYPNAFWNGRQMYYGDNYASALDIVGHEMTHGVTQYESDLFSWYQSGAINESMSDTMGELIQQIEGPQLGAYNSANAWKIGEDLSSGGFVRDMANPLNDPGSASVMSGLHYASDPDKMTSPNYNAYQPWDTDGQFDLFDNGGVHANAGVGNKTAYLIASGPSGTGPNTSFTFNNVAMTGVSGADQVERDVKVANIYYVLDQLMSSGASYADVYNLLPQACNQLAGKSLPAVIHDSSGNAVNLTSSGTTSISSADCHQVSLAVQATALNKQPTSLGSGSGARVAAPSPMCTNGGSPTKKHVDNFEISNPLSSTGTYTRGNAGADRFSGLSVGKWWWTKTQSQAPDYQDPKSLQSLWGEDADPYAANGNSFSGPYDRQDSWVQMKSAITARVGTMLRFDDAWDFDYGPVDWTKPVDATTNPVYNGDGGRVEYSVDSGSHWYDVGASSPVTTKVLMVNGGYNGRITNTDGWFGSGYVDPNPLKGKKAFVASSHGWTSSRLDLSPLNGKSVLLRWRIAGDDGFGSLGWLVDNVQSYSCNPTHIAISAPSKVAKGKAAVVSGHVVRTGTHTPLANLPVRLWEKRHGTTRWVYVGTHITNKYGNVHWSRTHTVAYDYRVRMPGKKPFAPSNIAATTVRIG